MADRCVLAFILARCHGGSTINSHLQGDTSESNPCPVSVDSTHIIYSVEV